MRIVFFGARSDLQFMYRFRNVIIQLFHMETQAEKELAERRERCPMGLRPRNWVREHAVATPGYVELREEVNSGVQRATEIADRLKVPVHGQSVSPAMMGRAMVTEFDVFYWVLDDNTWGGLTPLRVKDALDQTVAACERRASDEFWQLINPLYWVWAILCAVVRIPFLLVSASGFDVSKIEEHFLGRAFKLLEIAGIVYLAIGLGLTKTDAWEFIKSLLW